jgi:hypothetical protein
MKWEFNPLMPRPRKPAPDNEFLNRLEELSEKTGSRTALAKRAGLSPKTVQNYFEGGEPTRPALIAIAEAGNVSIEWLCLGRGSKSSNHIPEGYCAVPFFDLRPSGWRIYALHQGEPSDFILLKEKWLAGKDVETGKLESIEAPQPFEPEIHSGELLVVDRSKGWSPWRRVRPLRLTEGAIYLAAREAHAVLRRLSWREPNRIVTAVLPETKTEEISIDDPGFQPLGIVIWRAGPPNP